MAILLDTSALIVLLRRAAPARTRVVAGAARQALEEGRALISAVSAAELFVGARGAPGEAHVRRLTAVLPVIAADRDIAAEAGSMGAYARARGARIPLPDLLIAATALALELPLLTCDADFHRGLELGGPRWGRLRLHEASVVTKV
ncbi:MAG: PIN domain-containing protein [Gemmatimonadota bacterium]